MLREGDWKLIYHVGMPAQPYQDVREQGGIIDLLVCDYLGGELRAMCGTIRSGWPARLRNPP